MTSGVASHADVLRGSSRVPGTRDEPLRTSARKARTVTGNSYVAITRAKLVFFISVTQVNLCGAELETGRETRREYGREGPFFVLFFSSSFRIARFCF